MKAIMNILRKPAGLGALAVLVLLLSAGCGVKKDVVPAPVDVDSLLTRAWSSYDMLNFDLALAQFDSVLNLDATQSAAYLGKGLILGYRGAFSQAHNFLNLAVFATGQSADLFAPNDTFPFDPGAMLDSIRYRITVPAERQPLIYPVGVYGLADAWFTFTYVDEATGQDTLRIQVMSSTAQPLPILHFDDVSFVTEIPDTPVAPIAPDTAGFVADTVVLDSLHFAFRAAYYYQRPGITYPSEIPVFAYSVNAAAYMAEEDYVSAVRSARTALLLEDTYEFPHYPGFLREHIVLVEAYSSYQLGFFQHTVDLLVQLDPDWTPPTDPASGEGRHAILEELEHLQQTLGTIF